VCVRWNPESAGDSPLNVTGTKRLANSKSASGRNIAAFACLIGARIIRAAIKKLGRSAGRQRSDKSDDIIDIVTFGQRGRKPRHLGPVEIVGVGAANPVKVTLV